MAREQTEGRGHAPSPQKGDNMAEKTQSKTMVDEAKVDAVASKDVSTPDPDKIFPRSKRPTLRKSDIPVPGDLDPMNFDETAFAAVITREGGPGEPTEFYIDGDKARWLHFQPKGQNLPKKRLYNVKAIKPNGHIIQIPFEPQFHNNAAGNMQDALGLRQATRQGFKVLIDWNTMLPIYCAAWGCWAQAQEGNPFCCEAHGRHTAPNRYRDPGAGILASGATTSGKWES